MRTALIRVIEDTAVRALTMEDLKAENLSVSWPVNPSDELLAMFDVVRVPVLREPEHDSRTERLLPKYGKRNGKWVQDWIVMPREMSDEELIEIKVRDTVTAVSQLLESAENAAGRAVRASWQLRRSYGMPVGYPGSGGTEERLTSYAMDLLDRMREVINALEGKTADELREYNPWTHPWPEYRRSN